MYVLADGYIKMTQQDITRMIQLSVLLHCSYCYV
jgi:hypothetical protein